MNEKRSKWDARKQATGGWVNVEMNEAAANEEKINDGARFRSSRLQGIAR